MAQGNSSVSPFVRVTPPEALLLRVTPSEGNSPGQYQIDNQHSKLADFDREYVSFGGYFGTHDPEAFAAAPQLLEAVKDVAASLAAAISILHRATEERKEPRQVVASNKMFRQMLCDYEGSLNRARTAISKAQGGDK